MTVFSWNALKYASMNNQECKIRSEKIDINSNKPTFYPYSTEVNKCSLIHIQNYVFLMLLKT